MLRGIIARAESSVVHHRGLSAVGECRLHREGWLVGLTSAWSFCHQKHTFLRTNCLGIGRFVWLFLSV